MDLITLILSVSKAVPIVDNWLRLLIETYTNEQIKKIELENIGQKEKRAVILKKIRETNNVNEKAVLFNALNDIT